MNWQRFTSWPAKALYAVLLALALLFLGYQWHGWRQEQAEVKPQAAEPTKQARKWKRKVRERPVAEAQLTAAEVERLVAKYQRPDLRAVPAPEGSTEPPSAPTAVLAEVQDKREMPAGADILTTLDAGGNVETTVVPRPVPFLGAPMRFRLYGEALTEEANLDRLAVRLGAEFRALRLGHLEIQPKAELFRDPLPLELGGYDNGVRGGVRVTFDF